MDHFARTVLLKAVVGKDYETVRELMIALAEAVDYDLAEGSRITEAFMEVCVHAPRTKGNRRPFWGVMRYLHCQVQHPRAKLIFSCSKHSEETVIQAHARGSKVLLVSDPKKSYASPFVWFDAHCDCARDRMMVSEWFKPEFMLQVPDWKLCAAEYPLFTASRDNIVEALDTWLWRQWFIRRKFRESPQQRRQLRPPAQKIVGIPEDNLNIIMENARVVRGADSHELLDHALHGDVYAKRAMMPFMQWTPMRG